MHRKDASTNHSHVVTFLKNNKIKISPSSMSPSKTPSHDYPWLFADNNKIDDTIIDISNAGKWILFVDDAHIDDAWEKIKKEVEKGNLWRAKVATVNPDYENHAIIVYVPDSADINEIKITYETLVNADVVQRDEIIKFKSDNQTLSNQYGKYAYLYTSHDLHTLSDQKLQFIYDLSNYRLTRDKEQTLSRRMYNTFFGMLAGMSASIKLSAVDKMLKLLRGIRDEQDEPLTWDELAALRDGRLGRHISNYEKLHYYEKFHGLPKEFIQAERDKVLAMSRYMIMR